VRVVRPPARGRVHEMRVLRRVPRCAFADEVPGRRRKEMVKKSE